MMTEAKLKELRNLFEYDVKTKLGDYELYDYVAEPIEREHIYTRLGDVLKDSLMDVIDNFFEKLKEELFKENK